ncbi:polyphosphate kinase 2, partial [Phyllobacterium sophorae]
MTYSKDKGENTDWLEAELADTLDEDYELELSEPAL